MGSELRMDVQPYGDGRVLLALGDLSLILSPASRDRLSELLGRAAMPGQEGTPHECSFPVQPPLGTILSPGPCQTCGKTHEQALAEVRLDEARAALKAATRTWACCRHCTRRPCAGHPFPCADGCNGAEGGHG